MDVVGMGGRVMKKKRAWPEWRRRRRSSSSLFLFFLFFCLRYVRVLKGISLHAQLPLHPLHFSFFLWGFLAVFTSGDFAEIF